MKRELLAPRRILVNAAGSPGVPAIIALAHRIGLQVVACDVDATCSASSLADAFFTDKRFSDPDYKGHLIGKARALEVTWILPNGGVPELAGVSPQIEGISVLSPDEATVTLCHDKLALYRHLGPQLAPRSWSVETLDELASLLVHLPPEGICVKPRVAEGSRGFYHIIHKLSEADLVASRLRTAIGAEEFIGRLRGLADGERVLRELVFCEFLPGREVTIVGFLSPTGARTMLPFERRSPGPDGVSTLCVLHPPSFVERVVESLLARLPGLRFYVDVQVKENARGELRIIDVNPRVSGLIACCTIFEPQGYDDTGVPLLLPEPPEEPKVVRLYYTATQIAGDALGLGLRQQSRC